MAKGPADAADSERRIRELETAVARLEREARRATEIVETAPDALVVIDGEGTIAFVNRRVRDLFGYRREDLLGRPLDVLLPERYRAGHANHIRHFFARPKTRTMGTGLELSARRADGSEFPVEISLSPLKLGDETLVASAIRDASERKQIERRLEEARDRAIEVTAEKTRFIAAASHDLRQPLQAAAFYLDLLTGGALDPEKARTSAAKAKECVDSLRAFLDQVLDLSKLDAGAVQVRRTQFPMQRVFERLGAKFEPLARDKGLELRIRPTQAGAHTDPILLGQILENLVSNAIRYTEQGGVLVGCRRRGTDLLVQVWDQGVGIPDEDRQNIFDAFYRVETGAGAPGGIGLGLAIVSELAALLDHRLALRSEAGRGTRFELTVPATDGEAFLQEPTTVRPLDSAVLAVLDDNVAIVDALRTVLEVAGHQVVAATTTGDLLAQLAAGERPDALITDYRLEDQSTGLDALERVREIFGASLPAIVLTGDSSFERLRRLGPRRGYRALAKPVDARELLSEIQDCLSRPADETRSGSED